MLRERLVGNILRHAFEYWCNAEKDLSERVEGRWRRIAMNH